MIAFTRYIGGVNDRDPIVLKHTMECDDRLVEQDAEATIFRINHGSFTLWAESLNTHIWAYDTASATLPVLLHSAVWATTVAYSLVSIVAFKLPVILAVPTYLSAASASRQKRSCEGAGLLPLCARETGEVIKNQALAALGAGGG